MSRIKRLIIADDHAVVRRGIRQMITRQDIEIVAEASDGQTAVTLASEHVPDLMILDLSLPGLNGLEVTRAVKAKHPSIEILLYTLHDREDMQIEALRNGVGGYVLKSDSPDHLVKAVDSLLLHRPYFSSVSQTLLERFLKNEEAPQSALTAREREVVQLVAEGKINKQVAHILGISIKTVETHRAAAMNKLGIRTTAELVRFAVRNGIVEA
ncbi:response regulator [Altererythrobacter salegens]|uniref:Response regulator n=1 Tax=Croceibacterium salegens TaxID=1737568 RepID=A0A6I4ST92_9SPHN|nr:response regulator transcription factor [Croceibacterium salegens]MXO58578.1 response regulator [Croceibacterium salegens]